MEPEDAELVIFDLDGTLVHLDVDWQGFRDRLAGFLDEDVLPAGADRPATWTLARLADRGEDEASARVLQILRSVELGGAVRSDPLEPGMTLFRRVQDGRPLALVTNNTRAAAQEALRRHGLRPHFEKVVALEDMDRHKPDPDGLEQVLSAFDVPRENVLFIGDGAKDRKAAEQAGIAFLDVDDRESA